MSDEVKVGTCKHPMYNWDLKLIFLSNESIGLQRPVARIGLYCKVCKARCHFIGEPGFSSEGPTVTEDRMYAIIPLVYPEVERMDYETSGEVLFEDGEDTDTKKTVH